MYDLWRSMEPALLPEIVQSYRGIAVLVRSRAYHVLMMASGARE